MFIQHITPVKTAKYLFGTGNMILYIRNTSWGCFKALSCTYYNIKDLKKVAVVAKSNIFLVKRSVSSNECTGVYHKLWQFVGRFHCGKSQASRSLKLNRSKLPSLGNCHDGLQPFCEVFWYSCFLFLFQVMVTGPPAPWLDKSSVCFMPYLGFRSTWPSLISWGKASMLIWWCWKDGCKSQAVPRYSMNQSIFLFHCFKTNKNCFLR